MTVKIEITADNAAEAREELARLLGTPALAYAIQKMVHELPSVETMRQAPTDEDVDAAVAACMAEPEPAAPVHVVEDALKATAPVEAPKRERGKPSPGKARRTKEEIAEDEAADRADASAAPESDAPANISTGEERIDPTSPEDAAQDAADEAAEVEATRSAALTHDDVRQALGAYVKAFGMPAAMEDGPKLIGFQKVSDIPAEQGPLGAAVEAVTAAIEANPFGRVRA